MDNSKGSSILVGRQNGNPLMKTEAQCGGTWTGPAPQHLEGTLPEGVELMGHAFLLSPAPCCSQLGLPFWAKVIGTLKSYRSDEIVVRIFVSLFGENSKTLYKDSDLLILDPGKTGEFDVKVVEFNLPVRYYRIDVEELAEDQR
jgi:hypothetical protein